MSELMRLNNIKPTAINPQNLGRGIGSGLGKTCGRGHKGQKSRSGSVGGGLKAVNAITKAFTKYGFTSRIGRVSDQVGLVN